MSEPSEHRAEAEPDASTSGAGRKVDWRRAVLRWVGTIALLAGTFYLVDVGEVGARLAGLDPYWLAWALVLSVPMFLLMAWRWWYTSRRIGADLPYRDACLDYYLSTLLSQVLPFGMAGEVARVVRHRNRLRSERGERALGAALRSVVLERISGQVALMIGVVAAALAWMSRGEAWVAGLAFGAVALWLAAGLITLLVGRIHGRGAWLEPLLRDALEGLIARGALAAQLAGSLAILAIQVAMFYCAARATGVELDFGTSLQVVPLVFAATTIPLAFAGWGVREASTAALYGLVGLSAEAGVAVAVTYGLLSLVAAAPGLAALAAPAREAPEEADAGGAIDRKALLHAGWMGAAAGVSAVLQDATYFVVAGLIMFGVVIYRHRFAWTPSGRFGAANAITSFRIAIIASLMFAFELVPRPVFVAMILLVFALDGLDGLLARRGGQASEFGGKLDVEADSYLVMVLCLLLWNHGIAGAWVLIAGLLRYLYVGAVAVLPDRGEEPRSQFGRWIFAMLVLSLAGAFFGAPPNASALAAVGTVLVLISHARSWSWLVGLRGK